MGKVATFLVMTAGISIESWFKYVERVPLVVFPMPTPTKLDVKNNLKEATEILDCLNVNDEKLQKIASIISDKIKEDPDMKKVVATLSSSCDAGGKTLPFVSLLKLLENDEILPLIERIISGLGNNPDIVENIEKKVLPILFSR